MIIVLKNADFSRNNIGNIPINLPIKEETKRIMSLYTKYPVEQENEFAQALNSLVTKMQNSGLYDKITMLALPSMASSIAECRINAKNGDVVSNESLFESLYTLDNGMLKRTDTTFEDTINTCGHVINHSSNDFTMFGIYFTEVTNGYTIEPICGGRINGWYGFKSTYRYISDGPSGQILAGGNNVSPKGGSGALLAAYGITTTPFVVSFDGDTVYYRDKRLSRIGVCTPTDEKLIQFYPLLVGTSNSPSIGSMMLYGCGYKLTESEVSEMYALLEEFYNNIL
ncbi:MAG: hypothetical protein IKT40_12515 [Bacilli bacterium]|nr:hypothetical protein [Bacilli bacterium]